MLRIDRIWVGQEGNMRKSLTDKSFILYRRAADLLDLRLKGRFGLEICFAGQARFQIEIVLGLSGWFPGSIYSSKEP